MARENSDQAIIYSSIALLQERFRQLQRVKQMREEREMLKILSSASEHTYDQPSKLFSNSDHPFLPRKGVAFAAPPPSPRVFLSLWPDSTEMKHAEDNFSNVKSPCLTNESSWLSDTPLALSQSIKTDHDIFDCDVDTSLHL